MKTKRFLVSEKTMSNWLDRRNGKCQRALLAAPIESLPCLDVAGLRHYEAQLLKICFAEPSITYTGLKERFERDFSMTCTKNTMMYWKQSPFKSKVVVSIDELRKDHLHFLKDDL